MIDNTIIEFLLKAKRATYAGKGAETSSSRPKSHDLIFKENEYMYYDTYLGGNEFAGEEALWVQDNPIWCMNYVGQVTGDNFSGDFLKEALLNVPYNKPFRGPDIYRKGKYTYKCEINGNFEWFQGYERIFYSDKEIYECFFHGSIIQ